MTNTYIYMNHKSLSVYIYKHMGTVGLWGPMGPWGPWAPIGTMGPWGHWRPWAHGAHGGGPIPWAHGPTPAQRPHGPRPHGFTDPTTPRPQKVHNPTATPSKFLIQQCEMLDCPAVLVCRGAPPLRPHNLSNIFETIKNTWNYMSIYENAGKQQDDQNIMMNIGKHFTCWNTNYVWALDLAFVVCFLCDTHKQCSQCRSGNLSKFTVFRCCKFK